MHRAWLPLSLAAALLVAPPAHALTGVPVAPAPAYAPPSGAEIADTEAEFLGDALRTLSDRSGDVFFLPRKYNFVTGYGPEHKTATHVRVNGQVQEIEEPGISHGVPWSYDRDIPLVLWGPGFIKAGQIIRRRTAQQDIAPTWAQLIGCPLPADAKGHVLSEALLPATRRPKVILTVVFDQGGENYYRLHPDATPFVDKLKREGTYFANTRVSHLDLETGMGHVAIGTGAYPMDHGLPSNDFWHGGKGANFYAFAAPAPEGSTPVFMMSPTLGDTWLRYTHNQALLMSYCYADRAAIGMGGHGSFYKGNKKPWVFYYDADHGHFTTNTNYYTLPEYLKDATPQAEINQLKDANGLWMGHTIRDFKEALVTPAQPRWETTNVIKVLENEPFGQDDVPDLIYMTLKATDASGHQFGEESEEAGANLAEQSRQFEKVVDALVKKVGRDNVVVALTADHGGPSLPEFTGGTRLLDRQFVEDINKHFDKTDDGFPVVESISEAQLWLNHSQMALNHVSYDDIKRYVEHYQVNGKPFFQKVYTRHELSLIRDTAGTPAVIPASPRTLAPQR